MAGPKHIYATFSGGYIAAATPLAAETWQFGIRFALVFGDVDPIGTLPSNWDPFQTTINRNETDWTISGNWSIQGPMTKTFSPDDWLNDQVAPAAVAFMGTSGLFSASAELREINVYPIGADGNSVPAPPYAAGSPIKLTLKTPKVGGGSGSNPPQVTAVVSLLTQQVGRKGRGRFYTPMPAGSPTGTGGQAGVMLTTWQSNLATAAKAFLEDASFVGVSAGDPRIQPIVVGSPWTNYASVQNIRIDSVFDTQQRRRRQLTGTDVFKTIDVG